MPLPMSSAVNTHQYGRAYEDNSQQVLDGVNDRQYPQQYSQQQQQYGQYSGDGQHGRPSYGASTSSYSNNNAASQSGSSSNHKQGGSSRNIADSNGNNAYPRRIDADTPTPSTSNASASSSSKPPINSPEEIEQSRGIARVHYFEFRQYLEIEGSRDPDTRAGAREKLTRLTRQQFQELSTDVYDELVRRKRTGNSGGGPNEYLPVRNEFHPKRNAARQKLSTLPKMRFRDLASDVYYELERRYPEFSQPERPYSSQSGRDYNQPRSINQQQQSSSSSRYQQQQQNAGGSHSMANEHIVPNKSTVVEEDVGGVPHSSSQSTITATNDNNARKRRSVDPGRAPSAAGYSGNNPTQHDLLSPTSETGSATDQPASLRSTSRLGNRKQSDNSARGMQDSPDIKPNHVQQQQHYTGNASGLASPDWNESSVTLARASETSSIGARLVGTYGNNDNREWANDELEKIKSEYEFKIATLQSRIQGLERDATDVEERCKDQHTSRIRNLENEIDELHRRNEDTIAEMEALRTDLEDARRQANKSSNAQATSGEASRLKSELNELQEKYKSQSDAMDKSRAEFEGLVDMLKEVNIRQDELVRQQEDDHAHMTVLETEAKDWKKRYENAKTELRNLKATSQLFVKPTRPDDDYMPTSPDGAILDTHVTAFQSSIDDLLIGGRSNAPSSVIIATKQVINAVARIDEDVQAYEAAGATDQFTEDDRDRLNALKSKCNATLGNLTTAARNHATGHGLSPVSLLDAAASHLTMTVIDLVRMLHMRKAGQGYPNGTDAADRSFGSRHLNSQPVNRSNNATPQRLQELRSRDTPSPSDNNRASPVMRTRTASDERNQSAVTQSRQAGQIPASSSMQSVASAQIPVDPRRAGMYNDSAPAFSQGQTQTNRQQQEYNDSPYENAKANGQPNYSTASEGSHGHSQDADLNELKNYLEAQTESIVHAITALLAAIRGGAPQTVKLDENLSQIITIVSAVVGILRENLPQYLQRDGETIIRDLSDNCDKLVALQASGGDSGTFSKQTKQNMATASFGVAKCLKSMNGLLGGP